MRYLLYGTKNQRQLLIDEIECIQNYVELERIRFDDSVKIDINITGNLEDRTIAPMLLIPFVENCFKHGANKNIDKTHIIIDIEIEDLYLTFKVSNTIPRNEVERPLIPKPGGIGLSNVKKRLELGYDPKDYHLSVFEKDNMFHVILKLKVNES